MAGGDKFARLEAAVSEAADACEDLVARVQNHVMSGEIYELTHSASELIDAAEVLKDAANELYDAQLAPTYVPDAEYVD